MQGTELRKASCFKLKESINAFLITAKYRMSQERR
jgi:hypothetical protein